MPEWLRVLLREEARTWAFAVAAIVAWLFVRQL